MTQRTRRRRTTGAVLLDVVFAIGIVATGAAALYGLMPTIYHSQALGNQQTKAVQLGGRMVENLQMLPPVNLNADVLTQLNLIDPGQTGSTLTFTKIPLDDSARYSPSTALPSGTGVMTLSSLAGGAVKANITITWKSPFGTRTYTTGTVVGGYR